MLSYIMVNKDYFYLYEARKLEIGCPAATRDRKHLKRIFLLKISINTATLLCPSTRL